MTEDGKCGNKVTSTANEDTTALANESGRTMVINDHASTSIVIWRDQTSMDAGGEIMDTTTTTETDRFSPGIRERNKTKESREGMREIETQGEIE